MVGVFTKPIPTMAAIAEDKPKQLQVFGITLLLGLLFAVATVTFFSRVTYSFWGEALVDAYFFGVRYVLTDELWVEITKLSVYAISIIMPSLSWLINSLILWISVKLLMGRTLITTYPFKRLSVIIGFSLVVRVILPLVNIIFFAVVFPGWHFNFGNLDGSEMFEMLSFMHQKAGIFLPLALIELIVLVWQNGLIYFGLRGMKIEENKAITIMALFLTISLVLTFVADFWQVYFVNFLIYIFWWIMWARF